MASDDVQPVIPATGVSRLPRREFVRRAALLGLSGSTIAAFLAACGGSATATTGSAAPTKATGAGATTATSSSASSTGSSTGGASGSTTSAARSSAASGTPAGGAATPGGGAASPVAGGQKYTGPFDGTLLFGAAISLTGGTANEGKLTRDGYDLWKEVYNDAGGIMVNGKHYKIETKYYDDESNGPKSATLVTQLIKQDKVNFLLGPYGTTSTLQDSTVAEQNKIPMVEGNGAAESIFNQGYEYTFGVLSPAKNYLVGCIDMALAQNPKPATVAILNADDSFSTEVAVAAKAYAEKQGMQVVYSQKYPNGSTDIRALLTECKGKNPDFFLNSGHEAEAVAIVQQSKELGFNCKGFAFSVGPSIPDFQTTLKADADYIFGGTQWTPALKYQGDDLFKTPENYNNVYKARFGYEPAYQSAESTACGITFVKAIEAAKSIDPQAVRDALAKLDFISFYGQIKFDDRGLNIYKPMAVEQWQKGEKVTVWPSDVANGKPLWPTPPWNSR